MPKPPYLLVSFDLDGSVPNPDDVIADIFAGFPNNAKPVAMDVEHLFLIEVPASQAMNRFLDVGMYLDLQDKSHGGAVRWVVQLCRVDEIASG